VSVRVRPLSQAERADGSPWAIRDKRIILQEPSLGIPCDFAFGKPACRTWRPLTQPVAVSSPDESGLKDTASLR